MRHSWNNPRLSGNSRRILRSNHRSGISKTNMFQRALSSLGSNSSSLLISLSLASPGSRMVTIGQCSLADRQEIERLIAEYHSSEGLAPIKERIASAVDQQLRGRSPRLTLSRPRQGHDLGSDPSSLHPFRGTWAGYDPE